MFCSVAVDIMACEWLSAAVLSVAPMKALCSERYDDWSSRFGGLGLKCLELTGDSLMYDYSELQDVHIILTTPVSSYYLLYCSVHTNKS